MDTQEYTYTGRIHEDELYTGYSVYRIQLYPKYPVSCIQEVTSIQDTCIHVSADTMTTLHAVKMALCGLSVLHYASAAFLCLPFLLLAFPCQLLGLIILLQAFFIILGCVYSWLSRLGVCI